MKTWEQSSDPAYAAKMGRIDRRPAIADGKAAPGPEVGADPGVVFCLRSSGR